MSLSNLNGWRLGLFDDRFVHDSARGHRQLSSNLILGSEWPQCGAEY